MGMEEVQEEGRVLAEISVTELSQQHPWLSVWPEKR